VSFGVSANCKIYCQDAEKGSELSIGDNVMLNTGVVINADCGGKIHIGNNVLIGPNVVLRAADHRFDRSDLLIREQGHEAGEIVIEDDVWLAANVVVLAGVRIGRGAVVAAGSVVTRDVQPFSVVAGVPAVVLRMRSD
jgi:acetyltransferase-like isoleucine patch superfamily enzyme